MIFFKNLALKVQLNILFFVTAIIPVFILTLYFYQNTKKVITNNQLNNLSVINKILTENISTYFFNRTQEVSFFEQNKQIIEFLKQPSATHQFFFKYLDGLNFYDDIMIVDMNKKVIFNTNQNHMIEFETKLRRRALQAIKDGEKLSRELTLSKAYYNHELNKNMLLLVLKVYEQKKQLGSIIFEMSLAPLIELLKNSSISSKEIEIVLASKMDNNIIFISSLKKRLSNNAGIKRNIIHTSKTNAIPIQNALNGQMGQGESHDYAGDKIVAAWNNIPALNLGLVSKIDYKVFMAPIARLAQTVFITLLLLSIVIIIISSIVASYLAKPIEELIQYCHLNTLETTPASILNDKNQIRKLKHMFMIMLKSLSTESLKLRVSKDNLQKSISENEKYQKQLEESSRFSALGEMAGSISHEINNPLTVIAGNVKLMKKKVEKNQYDKEYLIAKFILIEDVLGQISKIIKGMKELIYSQNYDQDDDQQAILVEVFGSLSTILKNRFHVEGINYEINLQDPIFKNNVYCSMTSLNQVLVNLINNAIDAISEQTQSNKWIAIDAVKDNEYIYVKVSDSGDQIPNHIKDKMFQAFYTSKDIGSGTGLGLSLSKSLLLKCGGDLFLDEDSTNTCFIMKLPLLQYSNTSKLVG